jgi:hypothetical protein
MAARPWVVSRSGAGEGGFQGAGEADLIPAVGEFGALADSVLEKIDELGAGHQFLEAEEAGLALLADMDRILD